MMEPPDTGSAILNARLESFKTFIEESIEEGKIDPITAATLMFAFVDLLDAALGNDLGHRSFVDVM